MTEGVPLAFYAPLKSPDHPAPSGDRTMARLLLRALGGAGFAPIRASALRAFEGAGDPESQRRIRDEAEREAAGLIAGWRNSPAQPRLWFTYHVYYKAPDWIGPRVAEALQVPYVVAEGSRAAKRARGLWSLGHAGAEAALDRADLVLVMTESDREALERTRPAGQRLVDLPPFIDITEWNAPLRLPSRSESGGLRLLTVAMMRPGDKLASYALLAETLLAVIDEHWSLDVVGDGEGRREVEQMFAPLGRRVRFHGATQDRASLAMFYERADLFVWPAVNEAYGMVLLEAQAFGCPVLAGAHGGVASVVRDGETGLLAVPGDPAAFGQALRGLLRDRDRRRSLGEAAHRFVHGERGLDQAAARLRAALMPLLARRDPR